MNTIIEKIRAEVERMNAIAKADVTKNTGEKKVWHQGIVTAYSYVLSFLSDLEKEEELTLQEQPVKPSVEDAMKELDKKIAKATKSWKGVDVDKMLAECRGYDEQPVSERLEEAINAYIAPRLDKVYEPYGEHRQKQLSKFNTYDLEEAIEYGAKWQKEQMMKEAVEGAVSAKFGTISIPHNIYEKYDGQKVKIIIVKED